MRLKEVLTEALELMESEPGLATMPKSKPAASAAVKALDRFIADAYEALMAKDPDYIRLLSLVEKLGQKKPDGPQRVKEACKKAGMARVPSGKDQAKKIAEHAVKTNRTKAFIKQFTKDPETLMREELIAVAAESPSDIRGALRKLLTDKKADKYAKAAGFTVVREQVRTGKKKGTTKFNQAATIDNAMTFLAPYIESMADAH